MVWKATTQLGCAVQNCNGIFPPEYGVRSAISVHNIGTHSYDPQVAHYYVCEYYPAGNVLGEFP